MVELRGPSVYNGQIESTIMTDARIVLTTIDNPDAARALAHALVERRLAACVSIVERVHSVYRWQDAVETADEWLLLIKTVAGHVEALEAALRELHPYQIPEFVVLPIETSTPEYLRWILANTSPSMAGEET